VNGIKAMTSDVEKASADMMYIPNMAMTDLNNGFNTAINDAFDYSFSANYTIEVPLNIDGREFARTTAEYTQAELNRATAFKQKLRGV
jgi:phage-related protein